MGLGAERRRIGGGRGLRAVFGVGGGEVSFSRIKGGGGEGRRDIEGKGGGKWGW